MKKAAQSLFCQALPYIGDDYAFIGQYKLCDRYVTSGNDIARTHLLITHYMYIKRVARQLVPSYSRTFVLSYLRTLVPSYSRTFVLSYLRTLLPSYSRTFVLSYLRTLIPSYSRTFVLSYIHTFVFLYLNYITELSQCIDYIFLPIFFRSPPNVRLDGSSCGWL